MFKVFELLGLKGIGGLCAVHIHIEFITYRRWQLAHPQFGEAAELPV